MATFWILRVFFHTLSTKTSHKTTFKLIDNVQIALPSYDEYDHEL